MILSQAQRLINIHEMMNFQIQKPCIRPLDDGFAAFLIPKRFRYLSLEIVLTRGIAARAIASIYK